MKNICIKLCLLTVIAGTFSSCLEARRASTCPSHDPHYFQTYPYTSPRKRKLVAEQKNVYELKQITANPQYNADPYGLL